VSDKNPEVPSMKVEVLYFGGCPTYLEAERTVREVLAEESVEADVELVAVDTDEEARKLRFPGSPTIRVDGEDIFPVPEWEDWRLGCRVYATPEGRKGCRAPEMVPAAVFSARR